MKCMWNTQVYILADFQSTLFMRVVRHPAQTRALHKIDILADQTKNLFQARSCFPNAEILSKGIYLAVH